MSFPGRAFPILLAAILLGGCMARMPDLYAVTTAPVAATAVATSADPAAADPAAADPAAAPADTAAAPGEAADGETDVASAGVASTAGPIALAPVAQPNVPFFSGGTPQARAPSAIVVDARTGKILYDDDADGLRYPASLTKMMTLYLLFEAIDQGRYTLASELPVSAEAASRPPSKLGLKPGETITVDAAIRAMSVRSTNDVAVVVAEAVAGSEEAFVVRMNGAARALGMGRTRFTNASGLPDERQVSTAKDMAILGRALMTRHRKYAGYFTLREWTYNGRRLQATNKLLGKVPGMRGIKTGYIRLSGFNLAASVERDGRHVIAVVFGGRTGAARDARIEELIETWLPKASGGAFLAAGFRN